VKNAEFFSPRGGHLFILKSWCNECVNQWRRERRDNPEVARKRAAEYRRAFPQKVKERFMGLGRYRFNSANASAKRHGKEWSLTKWEYYSMIARACEYCGGALPVYGIGLDRVDTKLGYLPGNVVPCCTVCNRVKQDHFTFDEMKKLGAFIAELRVQRKRQESVGRRSFQDADPDSAPVSAIAERRSVFDVD
jgi:hypothetical protein